MTTARLIWDAPAPGAWNMAVDESLLRSAADSGRVTLRIYAWSEPTLSLGYFQRYTDRRLHTASQHCPVVRRATGGGAILHDREITYSLTAAARDRLDPQLQTAYATVHQAWIRALARQGIVTTCCCQTAPDRERQFLCFARRTSGDLLLGESKVAGSAQRRHAGAYLQHGSLLLHRSPAAPELPGITDLTGQVLTGRQWLQDWVETLGRALQVRWEPGQLSDQERDRAREIALQKFAHDKWTLRR